MTEFLVKPAEFLTDLGWKYTRRGVWLVLKVCPFCDGGYSNDVFTFAVHSQDGNYFCHRAKCGVKGSFWKLIESQGKEPRDYREKAKTKKKRFIYGR